MESRKSPDELDLESLISALEKEDTKEELTDNDVVNFMISYGLKPGINQVRHKLLYDLYSSWSLTPVTSIEFRKILTRFIEIHNESYDINFTSFKISSILYDLLNKRELDRSKSHRFQKHFENFMKKYELTPGDNWIHIKYLYYMYDVWVYQIQKTNPIRKQTLSSFFNIYFDRKVTKDGYVFGMDKPISNYLSPEQIAQIDEGERYKRETKKKSKEKEEVKSKNEK